MAQSKKTYVPAVPAPSSPPPEPPAPTTAVQQPAAQRVDEPGEAVKGYRQTTESAQYVPAPPPAKLIEILPAEYQTTNPPLIYRLSKVDEPSRPEGRIAVSRTYRAKAFSCGVFYKPISRFLIEWKDE